MADFIAKITHDVFYWIVRTLKRMTFRLFYFFFTPRSVKQVCTLCKKEHELVRDERTLFRSTSFRITCTKDKGYTIVKYR